MVSEPRKRSMARSLGHGERQGVLKPARQATLLYTDRISSSFRAKNRNVGGMRKM